MNRLNTIFPTLGIFALITFSTLHVNAKIQTNTATASANDWYSESETHVETYAYIDILSVPRAMIKGSSSGIELSNSGIKRNYSSSDPNIIQIDSNGHMTAISAGTATITISNPDFLDRRSVSITVYDEETTDVALSSLPKKKVYQLGEELDFTGIELKFSGIRNYIGKWDAAIQLDGTWNNGTMTETQLNLGTANNRTDYFDFTHSWYNSKSDYSTPLPIHYRQYYDLSISDYYSGSSSSSTNFFEFDGWIITSEFDSQKPGIYTIYISQTEEVLDAENTPSFTVEVKAPESLQTGDADSSGNIDILDVITINKAILGKETLTESQKTAADINKNGTPDTSDSMMILKYIVGLIKTL